MARCSTKTSKTLSKHSLKLADSDKPLTRSAYQRQISSSSAESANSTQSLRRQRESSSDSDQDSAFTKPSASHPTKKIRAQQPPASTMDKELKDFMSRVSAWGPSIANIDVINARMASIETKIDGITTQIAGIETRLLTVERSGDTAQRNIEQLGAECVSLKARVNKLEQMSIANEFLLHGLPPSVTSQDVETVLANFGNQIEVEIKPEDFDAKPRIFTNRTRTSSSIIGTFKSPALKSAVSKAFKAKRPIVVEDLVELPALSTLRGKQVVLRNSLTAANREILREAIRLKGEQFKFAWDVDGRIHLRKDEHSRAIEITSVEHLRCVIAAARNES